MPLGHWCVLVLLMKLVFHRTLTRAAISGTINTNANAAYLERNHDSCFARDGAGGAMCDV